jgi:hypothetical protein
MANFPTSLIDFQRRFPDEDACAAWLFAARWPMGFRCPGCDAGKSWPHGGKRFTYECASCGKQTSVTAGTIAHGSKLKLTVWFWASYLMSTHSNGISALQLQKQLPLGSYKTAWLLAAKPRRAMIAPDRGSLAGIVEVDETTLPLRGKDEPLSGGGGRSHQGKMLLAGAVEIEGDGPRRFRLGKIENFSAASLHGFVVANVAQGATIKTDGWAAYPGTPGVYHDPHVVGAMAAHVVLPWIHRVFSNLKAWASASITACATNISRAISTSSSAQAASARAGSPAPSATRPAATIARCSTTAGPSSAKSWRSRAATDAIPAC